MFVHLSIHSPKPEYEPELIESMHRFGAAVEGAPGLRHAFTLKDEISGRLVGLMVWDSREQRDAVIERSRIAVEHDDFDLWEQHEPEGFLLDEV